MTKDFLDLVLPDAGHRCIAAKSNGNWPHTFHSDNGRAAEKASLLDLARTSEVYFGCASYLDPAAGRKGANAVAVRSFWLDIDTRELKGNGNASYANRQEAASELERFCFELAMPSPTVVSSGYGLHIYWAMDTDLGPDEWHDTALILRRACDFWKLKVDHSRTVDIASILRVPGTHNRKDVANPRTVRVLGFGRQVSHADFRRALSAYAGETTAPGRIGELDSFGLAANVAHFSPPDRWFDRLSSGDKNACLGEMLQVQAVVDLADTSDADPEPNWRTILAACARSDAPNAYSLCRAWAQTSPRFRPDDFDTRWRSFACG